MPMGERAKDGCLIYGTLLQLPLTAVLSRKRGRENGGTGPVIVDFVAAGYGTRCEIAPRNAGSG